MRPFSHLTLQRSSLFNSACRWRLIDSRMLSNDSLPNLTTTQERLTQSFLEQLAPLGHYEIVNESFMHKVPKNAETHFKVILVSSRFQGLPLVQRHRLVYGAAQSLMQAAGGTIHALAITAKTPEEWQALSEQEALKARQRSPPCLGGSHADEKH